jgi:peptidoglycan/LPS O-acetylase OafA/YrhL
LATIGAILLAIEKFHAPGLIVLQAVLIPALVLITVIQPGNSLGRVLEWQPLRWIGTISYSLYLWQEIFLPQLASQKSLVFFTMFSSRRGMCSQFWRVVVLADI